jgi:hypothetical protein
MLILLLSIERLKRPKKQKVFPQSTPVVSPAILALAFQGTENAQSEATSQLPPP